MKSFLQHLHESSGAGKSFSKDDAKRLGDSLKIDWDKVDLEQFRIGLGVESEHDDGSDLDVVDSEKDLAKIVLAHLKEKPDYYTRLKKVEEDAPANSVAAGGVAGMTEPFGRNQKLIKRKPTDIR